MSRYHWGKPVQIPWELGIGTQEDEASIVFQTKILDPINIGREVLAGSHDISAVVPQAMYGFIATMAGVVHHIILEIIMVLGTGG
jgi:hypothetical protein